MSTSLCICRGDALDRFFRWVLRSGNDGPARLPARMALLMVATWGMQALLAMVQGNFSGSNASFLMDYAAIVQYLITLPLLLAANDIAAPFVDAAIGHFISSGLLPAHDAAGFRRVTAKVLGTAKSVWMDIFMLCLGLALTWTWILPSLQLARVNPDYVSWHIVRTADGPVLSLAVLYAGIVAGPLFLYSHFRWILKVAAWIVLLVTVSGKNLRSSPLHPDRSGGLYFLSRVQTAFGILIFAIGCEVAATVGYNIFMESGTMFSLDNWIIWVPFVIMAPLAFMLPLLLFSRRLFLVKSRGIFEMSRFANDFTSAFDKRHLAPEAALFSGEHDTPDSDAIREYLDGADSDIQSLADLQTAFEAVRTMKILPFDFASLGKLTIAAAGPMLPLFVNAVPGMDALYEMIKNFL